MFHLPAADFGSRLGAVVSRCAPLQRRAGQLLEGRVFANPYICTPSWGNYDSLFLGAVCGVLGAVGDLFESFAKRSFLVTYFSSFRPCQKTRLQLHYFVGEGHGDSAARLGRCNGSLGWGRLHDTFYRLQCRTFAFLFCQVLLVFPAVYLLVVEWYGGQGVCRGSAQTCFLVAA